MSEYIHSNLIALERSSTLAINEHSDNLEKQGKHVFRFGLKISTPLRMAAIMACLNATNASFSSGVHSNGRFSDRNGRNRANMSQSWA